MWMVYDSVGQSFAFMKTFSCNTNSTHKWNHESSFKFSFSKKKFQFQYWKPTLFLDNPNWNWQLIVD
jgi:hypothetical protein